MPPIVSVVIPTFNVAPYVVEAVRSARAQTLGPIEVIAVDDGSTDGTAEILDTLAADARANGGPPLHVVRQENRGASAARNAGLARASGRYIAFLDGDDRWHPRHLEQSVAALEDNPELDLTFAWYKVIDEQGRSTGLDVRSRDRVLNFEDIVLRGGIASSSLLVGRREAIETIGGFDETLRSNNDLDFCLRLSAVRRDNIGAVREILVDYRKRPGQVTADWRRHADDWKRVIAKAWGHDPDVIVLLLRRAYANKLYWLATEAYRGGKYADAGCLLRQAWRLAPLALAMRPKVLRHTVQYAVLTALPERTHAAILKSLKNFRRFLSRCMSAQMAAVSALTLVTL
jgi:glycosyltransferase involved in cell wall biosynthesis